MKEMLLIIVSAALVNNVVLSQFLGLCAFLGVSKTTNTAAGMGGAVIFVITLSSFVTSLIYKFILVPLDLTYLQTIVFILIIAALVQFVEMFLKKSMTALYKALGVYLPLITTNCAVLGVAVVDREACKACGKCVAKCPRHLIQLIPYEQQIFVGCSSHAKGKAVTSACDVGCIGCKKCEKTCPNGAITVTDFCAQIDPDKCTGCGQCKEVCPRGIIR